MVEKPSVALKGALGDFVPSYATRVRGTPVRVHGGPVLGKGY